MKFLLILAFVCVVVQSQATGMNQVETDVEDSIRQSKAYSMKKIFSKNNLFRGNSMRGIRQNNSRGLKTLFDHEIAILYL